MSIRIDDLTVDEVDLLDEKRALIERHAFADDELLAKYDTPPGKLAVLRRLIEAEMFQPEQIYEWHAMGVVLGDALAAYLGLDWFGITDADGRSPGLHLLDSPVVLFPITMISKRIEAQESPDVFELFSQIAAQVNAVKSP